MNSDAVRSATSYDFDCLVFIGRFQPPHLGHLAIIREALKKSAPSDRHGGLILASTVVTQSLAFQ